MQPTDANAVRQFDAPAGAIDLAWGHPAPSLLAVEAIADAAAAAVRRYGPDALTYGANAGPGPAIEQVRRRLAIMDARTPAAGEVLVTAGSSWALDQVATLLTRPGDTILVEAPTYHLALRIFGEHPVRMVGVPADRDGLDIDALASAVREERAAGARVRLVYAVPTFANPTGVSLAAERRRALAGLLAAEDLLLVEDDAYRELSYEGDPPPSVWSEAAPGTVLRLGTFSKSLAPGLRAGFLTGAPALVRRFTDAGMLDSGGGVAPVPALLVAELIENGFYATNLGRLRDAYRAQRDGLVAAIASELADVGAEWNAPAGGYFVWLRLPGVDARALRAAAVGAGTGYLPGSVFHLGGVGGTDRLRLAFSRYSPADLHEAMRRLRRALG